MADGSEIESSLLMEVTTASSTLCQTDPIQMVSVTEGVVQVPETEAVAEDILQQAFVEAEDFVPNSVEYTPEETHDASVAAQIVNNVIGEGTLVTSGNIGVEEQVTYTDAEYGVVTAETENVSVETTLCESEPIELPQANGNDVNTHEVTVLEQPVPPDTQVSLTSVSTVPQPGNVRVAVIPAPTTTSLGASSNPIRIVLKGNQYTPEQSLTQEQRQQMMQVLQHQQLAKTISQGGGSIVLFNPQTETRIVCKVISPSELHKNQTPSTSHVQTVSTLVSQQKRAYKKRLPEDDEDKVDGPELSKEEKEERKKHRPRTRSGRVSKPPKHMMKDYKHIHVLDWDEDYDDSDGGYSDYKCSDEEKKRAAEEGIEIESVEKEDNANIYAALGATRPKNYKCETCEKAYIGQAGLSRHYRLNPAHGSVPESEVENDKSQDGTGRTNGNLGSLSEEDSNTQDSFPGLETSGAGTPSPVAKRGYRGRGRGRGRHMQELSQSRRKSKLKEIVRQCQDEDLMEIVLPRLAKVITLYEFLLMKVEKGFPSRPHADDIYREFETLHKQVQKVCQMYLKPVGKDTSQTPNRSLQVENTQLAQALNLEVGGYNILDMPAEETTTFQPKPEPATPLVGPHSVKRQIQVTSPDQLPAQPGPKRQKTTVPETNVLRKASTPVGSVQRGTPQFRVVSAASRVTAMNTPHIITVSNPDSVGVSSNNVLGTPKIVALSAPNFVSNSKIVTVSSPNVVNLSTPHVIALSNSVNSNQQLVTLAKTNSTAVSLLQPQASGRPPESSVQNVSQSSGVAKSQVEILTSQAATSTVLTEENVVTVDDVNLENSVPSVVDVSTESSAISSANIVINSNATQVNSSNGLDIVTIPNEEQTSPLKTMVINGNLDDVEMDVQNIRVVNSLEEAQQIVIQQSHINGVDPGSNMNTLAEVVQNQSDNTEHTIQTSSDVKSEMALVDSVNMKQEEVEAMDMQGEIISAEQLEGQVIDQDQEVTHSNIFQTEDGILIIQNPDGTTFQLQGAEGIPLETVQALLAMEGQFEQGEPIQAELQQ